MNVIFFNGFKWSDGQTVHRFPSGPASVPAECGKLAIEQGAAKAAPAKRKPKPVSRRAAETKSND